MQYLIKHLSKDENQTFTIIDIKICRTKEIMQQYVDQLIFIHSYYELYKRVDKKHSWKLVESNVPGRIKLT